MLKQNERVPTMVAYAVRSYGYEVAVLDQEGQILSSCGDEPGIDYNETRGFARQTAAIVAEENGIPLRQGKVFQHDELMMTAREVEEIQ